jgi:hypothetical protein
VVAYVDDQDDTVAYIPIFGRQPFLLVDSHRPTVPVQTTADYDKFETGTNVAPDSNVAIEIDWWAPKHPDTCGFVIQRMRIYSFDGQSHGGLRIGQVIDWDIPSDNSSDNTGGYDTDHRLIYQSGIEADYLGCQYNDSRFGGMAFLASFVNDSCNITSGSPFAAYTESNPVYVWPNSGFVPKELYVLMGRSGYEVYAEYEDIHSALVYFSDYTMGADDTLNIYTAMSTVMNGTANDLIDNIEQAEQWIYDHIIDPCFMCGDANGDGTINVADPVFLIEYIFKGGPPPNPLAAGDVNCDGDINVSDVVYMIDYIFKGGPPPCDGC